MAREAKAKKSKKDSDKETKRGKGKAAKAEKATKKSRRSKAEKPEKETKKGKKAKAKDTERKKRRGKSEDYDEEDEAPAKGKGKKTKLEVAVTNGLDMFGDIDAELDSIDKDLALSGSSLNLSEQRMSTGLLGLDLVVGKGMVPGWYTVYGPEQSCKSTGAMAIMSSALLSAVPIKAYFDYEGCVTASSKIEIENRQTTIGELASKNLEAVRSESGLNLEDQRLHISSAGVRQNVLNLKSKGEKEIHRIVTESGREVEGFAHPILCVNEDGLLEWKLMEQIKVGDKVVTKARSEAPSE